MYQLDEEQEEQQKPFETLHIYVYSEEPDKPPRLSPQTRERIQGSILIFFLLCGIIALCLIPSSPAYTIQTISVPAHFLPPQIFVVRTPITPTGTRTYPATIAHGTITVFNGSILIQELPSGFILPSNTGIKVVTDQATTIPPGNPPTYGIASVPAHTITAGSKANIPAYAVNSAYGTPLCFLKTSLHLQEEQMQKPSPMPQARILTQPSQMHATLF